MAITRGPKIVRDGLVLYLDAGDRNSYPGSGTTWKDLSGNGNNGTLTNGPTFNSGSGGSIVFNGSSQYAQILADGKSTVFDTQTYTIESIFQITGVENVLWSFDYTSHSNVFYSQHLRESNSYLYFLWNDGSTFRYISAAAPNLNNWAIVSATFASGYQAIYFNGSLLISSVRADVITYYNQEVWIGRGNYPSSYFSGKIASTKFYNRALTAAEIQQNYNATKGRFNL